MTTPEGIIKKEICDYLDTVPGLFYWRAQGGSYGTPGVPDLVCCYKGRWVGLEVKTHAGRVSEYQKAFKRRAEAAGGVYEVVRSADDARRVIETL